MTTVTNNEKGTASAPLAKLVRATDIAKLCNVNKRTVELWAQKKLVPCYRMGATLRFDLEETLRAMRKGEAAQ